MDSRRKNSPTGVSFHPLEKALYLVLKESPQFKGKRLLLGVSGGRDSMALLSLMCALQTRMSWSLAVGHLNHGLRGNASDLDERLVQKACERFSLPFFSGRLRDSKKSENFLREKRYEFLGKIMSAEGCDLITTAHHMDDLLETRLMRLIQGVGVDGIRGMEVVNQQGIFRPLLGFGRSEIEAYIRDRKIEFREDKSNKDTKRLRNWIRHKWLSPLRNDHPFQVLPLTRSLELLGQKSASMKRSKTLQRGPDSSEAEIFSFMRQFTKGRISQKQILEFRKRLGSSRKSFVFRLAKVDWKVEKEFVFPL